MSLPEGNAQDYETFRKRAEVKEDDDDDDDQKERPNSILTPKERFHRATRKCIAMNSLKSIILQDFDTTNIDDDDDDDDDKKKKDLPEQPTTHFRNAGTCTIIAFVNSASGGGVGKLIHGDLVKHLGEDHVFDLKSCQKGNMPEDRLLLYARDPGVRILACGGDGTMGWIESCIDKVWRRTLGPGVAVETTPYSHHLPLAIMPLGTGNDLSRQFGWGGKYKDTMRSKRMIQKVERARPVSLDRWRCRILPLTRLDGEARAWVPKMLCEKSGNVDPLAVHKLEELFADEQQQKQQDDDDDEQQASNISSDSTKFFDGLFNNYVSLGFDASVAFEFHREREEHPEKFTSPLKNKIIYLQKAPAALRSPFLHDKIRVMVKNNAHGKLEELTVPKDCRGLVLLNIQSYAGGHKLTSSRGKRTDDGLMEVIFCSNLVRTATSIALAPILPFLLLRVAAQTNTVCIRTKRALHCQVDGEPWLQSQAVIQINHYSRNALLKHDSRAQLSSCASWNCASSSQTPVVK